MEIKKDDKRKTKNIQDNTIRTAAGSDVYENDIYILCDEYISTLDDPEKIYNNRCFTGLVKYIYLNYIANILNNNNSSTSHRYNDIGLIDKLFNIYVGLCYKYNNIPTILEFSIFTGISRDTFNTWKNNSIREVTTEYSVTCKKWFTECELAQVKEKDVKSIFLLKANYNYNDNLQAIPLESQQRSVSIEALPNLAIEASNTDIM